MDEKRVQLVMGQLDWERSMKSVSIGVLDGVASGAECIEQIQVGPKSSFRDVQSRPR